MDGYNSKLITLYDPGGSFIRPPPLPSNFLPSRISFWSYTIVRWGLFAKRHLLQVAVMHLFLYSGMTYVSTVWYSHGTLYKCIYVE